MSAANEGDAVALIAGVTLGGRRGIAMMQNSGLGNAVSPLTSLTWTFRLPQLLIVTWRGQPGVPDEPQHALMGPITPAMLDTMEIPWEMFPTDVDAIGPALDRATAHMEATGRPYALVMQKGSVASYALKDGAGRLSSVSRSAPSSPIEADARPSRHEALLHVVTNTPVDSTVVFASTGFCGRELYAIDDRPNQLYMVGSMGCVTPFALGFALARPDLQVLAIDGDGAALMRMGAFATLGAYGPPNLTHVLLDNGAHESTGGQATVSRGVSFAAVASACGYAAAVEVVTHRDARRLPRRPDFHGRALRTRFDPHRDAGRPASAHHDAGRREASLDDAHRFATERRLMLLLNPGPVTLTERVRHSLLQPDLCHRESEFYDLQDEARARLLEVYALDPTQWSAVLITGSGTAAVESMIAALVPDGGKLLIVENGMYGERIAQIAGQYRIAHEGARHDWMDAVDLQRIAVLLDADGTFTHVALIHHETTTGRLNDLEGLAAICRERGVRLLIDGVSSFGAEAIAFDDDCVDAEAGAASKCLHGVPGVSFVIVRRSARPQATSRTYNLDFVRLARLQDQRNTPFTAAVHVYYAMVEALREFEEEGGREARHARYAALAAQARAGLAERGIHGVLPAGQSSVVLRAYSLASGLAYPRLHDGLKSRGFVIYAGQGGLSATLFRISTMGAVTGADVE